MSEARGYSGTELGVRGWDAALREWSEGPRRFCTLTWPDGREEAYVMDVEHSVLWYETTSGPDSTHPDNP